MLGIAELISAARSPWQNAYVERRIGSIRRECTDQIIPLSDKHLLRTVHEYQAYCNESRTHSSLDGNSPTPRRVAGSGEFISTPVLGGLHHRYLRSALSPQRDRERLFQG